MNTTFIIEKGCYNLAGFFFYQNSNSNKTEIAALALIANEGEINFNFVLSEIKKLKNRDDFVILIDKDFNDIDCLQRIFGNSTILFCVFHVLKYTQYLQR